MLRVLIDKRFVRRSLIRVEPEIVVHDYRCPLLFLKPGLQVSPNGLAGT